MPSPWFQRAREEVDVYVVEAYYETDSRDSYELSTHYKFVPACEAAEKYTKLTGRSTSVNCMTWNEGECINAEYNLAEYGEPNRN